MYSLLLCIFGTFLLLCTTRYIAENGTVCTSRLIPYMKFHARFSKIGPYGPEVIWHFGTELAKNTP